MYKGLMISRISILPNKLLAIAFIALAVSVAGMTISATLQGDRIYTYLKLLAEYAACNPMIAVQGIGKTGIVPTITLLLLSGFSALTFAAAALYRILHSLNKAVFKPMADELTGIKKIIYDNSRGEGK